MIISNAICPIHSGESFYYGKQLAAAESALSENKMDPEAVM